MKTIILAGGKGLRYNSKTPKPLATIGNKSILEHVMDIYINQGFNEFLVAVGYNKDIIIDYFNNMKNSKMQDIQFIDTGENTDTAQRIKLLEKHINDDNFFCTYSDGLMNVNLHTLKHVHMKSNAVATITVVRHTSDYGMVRIRPDGKIIDFIEKPVLPYWINGGFFIFKKDIFDHILKNDDNLERQIFPRLTHEDKLFAYLHYGYFDTLNTAKDEQRLNDMYDSKDNKTLPWLIY